ncbi:MAG: type II/IV secretion system protein, partial [Burkholderiaceae bacterium]
MTTQNLAAVPVLDPQVLARARALAAQSKRSVITELQELTKTEPRQLVQTIALLFDLPVAETTDMLALKPAFDLLSLSKSMQHHCVLLRQANDELIG